MPNSNIANIYADPNDTRNIGVKIEPFAGDVARDYALKAKASAEAAAASEEASDVSETAAKASEEAAAASESAAKISETNAKAAEEAAAASAAAARASENAAAGSAQEAKDAARGVGNPVADVSEKNGKVTVTKADGTTNEFFADLNILQRNKAYKVGDIAYSPRLPSYMYLECVTAGTTGAEEPDFSSVTTGGGGS